MSLWSHDNPVTTKRSTQRGLSCRVWSDTTTNYGGENYKNWTTSGLKLSSGHNYRELGRSDNNIGGGFLVDYTEMEFSSPHIHGASVRQKFGHTYQVAGYLIPPEPTSGWYNLPAMTAADDAYLVTMGTRAIAQVLPTNSHASAAVALGEFRRDGIPHIVGADVLKSRLREYRSYGSEYLNVEFGWKPFVNDIKEFCRSVRESDKILNKYYAEADRLVHRRYEFPGKETVVQSVSQPGSISQNAAMTVGGTAIFSATAAGYNGTTTETLHDIERTWFSGAFRYHVPTFSNSFYDRLVRYKTNADILYGATPDPETLWNLAPWTWAADWFSDTGDVIHNLNAFSMDGLTMQYGYIMASKERHKVATLSGLDVMGVSAISSRKLHVRRRRMPASPFGFGLTEGDLTDRQIAILASIAASSGKRRRSY